MSVPAKEYSPDEYVMTLCGIVINSGFADGEFLTLEENSPRFVMKKGSDGSVTRCRSLDRSAKAVFKLMNTSDINDQLSALAQQDQAARNGAGVGAFEIKDIYGTTIFHGSQAWISEMPKVSLDREATPREWMVDIAALDPVVHGGR